MSTLQHSSPLLALIARRQFTQSMAFRSRHSSQIINIAHSQCKLRQLSQYARLYSTAQTESRATHHEPIYNATGSQAEKLLKIDAVTRTPPPVIEGEPQEPSPLSKSLSPTQSSPPFIPDTTYNPPASTRPVALELPPPRQESQSKFSHLIKIGRAYLTFYKRGFQNINASRKAAKVIRARMASHKKHFEQIARENPDAAKQAMSAQQPPWTRAEFQLLRRSSHDMSRLPVFGLLFVVFGEFLPLVMLAAKNRITPVLPYTVRLPVQVGGMRKQMLLHRAAVETKWDGKDANNDSIDNFALYGAEYFKLGPPLWPVEYQPRKLVLRNTRRYYEYLLYDDVLLGKEGVEKLVDDEVVIAAIERGVWDDVTDTKELRARLQRAVLKSLGPATDTSAYGRPRRK